jgi:hypothetical protein
VRRDSRPGRRRGALVGLTVAGLLATTTAGVAQAENEGDPAAPIPVAVTGPATFDLSLQAEPPEPGESSFEFGVRAPGPVDPDGDDQVEPVWDGKYTLTIDASGMKGVADVELPSDCEVTGLVAVCSDWFLFPGDARNGHWDVSLIPNEDSAVGDRGSIVVTGAGEGLDFTGHTVDVLVGGPEFTMKRLSVPQDFSAGSVYGADLGFRNVGGMASKGAVLRLSGSRGLSFPEKYSNCSYAVENEDNLIRMRRVVLCTFDGTYEPGAAYKVASPVKVKTADFALFEIFAYRFTAVAPAEAKKLRDGANYRRGSGPELRLEQVASPQGEYTRFAELDFPRQNPYDLDLVGDRLQGEAGATVNATITMHNYGPAWIGSLRAGGESFMFTVDVPEGASVTKEPERCQPYGGEDGEGRDRFLCWVGTPVLEKDKREYVFELRIDEVVEGANGRVAFPDRVYPNEGDPSNDTGWIVLNGNGDEETPGDTGGTGGSDDGTPPGDGTDGTDGTDGSDDEATDGGTTGGGADDGTGTDGTDTDGGSLALTGSGAMTLGGFALALLAAGGALLVVRRRRAVPVTIRTDDAAA